MKVKTIVCNVSILVVCALLTGNCFSPRRVKGDGHPVTREIAISDYQAILCSGSMKIDYTCSDDAPGLTVTVDRNIFEMYEFSVHDGKLRIKPKEEYKDERFAPTLFTVVTNSTALRKLEASGKTEFAVNSPLRTDELKFSLAGSTKVDLKDSVILRKLNVEIAGNGTLNAFALAGETFDGQIAGSGNINLGGQVATARFEIAGNGSVHAFDLQTEEVKCTIAGHGKLEISANSSIHAEIAGSGKIRYRGDPRVVSHTAGLASIRKAD
ncbi:MAG: DUF2807 domain-containing protein [Tannerella sp.]|jgi:hypothetical protein|nr:DUF2807 domain-containing protein [Tannerella sp.]MDR1336480.1 DUF2807 domain-containing protein [Tannerella sp.]